MKSALAAAVVLLAVAPALAGASGPVSTPAAAAVAPQPVWLSFQTLGVCSTFCSNGQSFEQVTTQTTQSTCCSDAYNPCPAGWSKRSASFTPQGGRAMLCPIT
jgi:hypothetical protein